MINWRGTQGPPVPQIRWQCQHALQSYLLSSLSVVKRKTVIFFKEFRLACLRENTQGSRECGRKGPNA